MKILSDESRILRLSPNVWYGVVIKDIKLSGTLQDEQVGVLIIKLKGSTLVRLRNHDLVTTSMQDSFNGFSELIHWCVAVASALIFSLNLYYFTSHCVQ